MRLKARVGKIVAASKEEVWGQVFLSGNFYLVVEISVPQGYEASPLGKEIISNLYSQFTKLPAVNLESLKKLIFSDQSPSLNLQIPKETKLNLLLCTLINDIFYLLILGGGRAFLKREKKMAILLDGQGSGSGILKEGDLIILSSPKFSQIVSFETLKSALNNLPPEAIAENLAPFVHSQENSFGATALILKFEKEEEVKEDFTLDFQRKIKKKIFLFKEKLALPFILKRRLREEEKTKRTVLTVAIFLTLLLILSIFFSFRKKERGLKEEKLGEILESASHNFEEGKALLPLNTQKSRELLKKAKKTLEEGMPEFKKKSKERRKIEDLLKKVNISLKKAEKVYKLTSVPLFFDPVFLKDKAFGENLALYKDSLVILDRRENTLYYLLLKEKKGKILAGGKKLEGAKLAGIHGENAYVLTNEGIVEVSLEDQTLNLRIKKDKGWEEIVDLVAYRGNVYLLAKNGIVKYLKKEEGFAKTEYLAPGTKIDFSSTTSMAIDGEIWLTKGSEVLRFSLGEKKDFLPKGLEVGLGSNLLIYTDEESQNIYLLDKNESRVVVLNKEGEYQAQYEWEKLEEAADIVVSEKEGKILVLVGGKIYGIEIKK